MQALRTNSPASWVRRAAATRHQVPPGLPQLQPQVAAQFLFSDQLVASAEQLRLLFAAPEPLGLQPRPYAPAALFGAVTIYSKWLNTFRTPQARQTSWLGMQSLQQHFGRLASHHAASTSGRASSQALGALSAGAALARPTHSAAAATSGSSSARGSRVAARAAASPFRTLPSLPAGGLASLSLDVEPDLNALELRDVSVGAAPALLARLLKPAARPRRLPLSCTTQQGKARWGRGAAHVCPTRTMHP